jgi:hypothetical protein
MVKVPKPNGNPIPTWKEKAMRPNNFIIMSAW